PGGHLNVGEVAHAVVHAGETAGKAVVHAVTPHVGDISVDPYHSRVTVDVEAPPAAKTITAIAHNAPLIATGCLARTGAPAIDYAKRTGLGWLGALSGGISAVQQVTPQPSLSSQQQQVMAAGITPDESLSQLWLAAQVAAHMGVAGSGIAYGLYKQPLKT